MRFRGQFACVTGHLPDGSELPLCRLRYVGYASTRGFAIYRASHDDYRDNYLPSGQPSGTPKKPSTAPAASTSATPPPGSHRHTIAWQPAPLRCPANGSYLDGDGLA